MAFDVQALARNIRLLVPYSSARDEFTGNADLFLDANENSFGSPLDTDFTRYPEPVPGRLLARVSEIYNVDTESIFIGHGSDEVIDLVVRLFCEPRIDSVIVCPPTYGMYEVAAAINDTAVTKVDLGDRFLLDVDSVLDAVTEVTKMVFLCSPNNPSGNCMAREDILRIARKFDGLVIVDEAYIEFAAELSLLPELANLPNLVILRTLSKAWGLAGLRIGFAFASREVVALLNRIKPPYNISQPVERLAAQALGRGNEVFSTIDLIVRERESLAARLRALTLVEEVYPSDANFLLVRVGSPQAVYRHLSGRSIVVRDRSTLRGCEGCLRITVGTPAENARLITALEEYEKNTVH